MEHYPLVSFTKGGPSGPGRVDEAAANARQLTRKYAAGFGVDVDLEIPSDLPEVAASQTAVEELIVTLISAAAETRGVSRVTVAARHAGAPVHVSVAEVEIAGGAPIRQDADLTILGELTARLGGKLRIDACAGGGTRVTVDLPVA